MAINFPDNPILNEEFIFHGTIYVWDGVKWLASGGLGATGPLGPTGPKGDDSEVAGPTGPKGEEGLPGEWDTAQTVNDKTASYTLLTVDAGKLITVSSSSNLDVTVDGSLDLSVGQRIDLLRLGAGEVTVVADNATVNGTPGFKLRAQYSSATLLCIGDDSYVLLGDLEA